MFRKIAGNFINHLSLHEETCGLKKFQFAFSAFGADLNRLSFNRKNEEVTLHGEREGHAVRITFKDRTSEPVLTVNNSAPNTPLRLAFWKAMETRHPQILAYANQVRDDHAAKNIGLGSVLTLTR